MADATWKCRKCDWTGVEPDTAPANNHGYIYRAALCPKCGFYFNDLDFSAALQPERDNEHG